MKVLIACICVFGFLLLDKDAYIAYYRGAGRFGGNAEIMASADLRNKVIVVHNVGGQNAGTSFGIRLP
jgi:hypothetical protein